MNEKEYTEGIVVKSKAAKRIENFWYHYKWHTLIIAFFVIVFTVCTVQMCTKEEFDITFVYAGSESLDARERENIINVFEYLTEEEGYSIGLTSYNVLSENEIKDMAAETDEDGEPVFVNRSFYNEEYQVYSKYLMTGESSVMLLSPFLYEELASADRLRSVDELTDSFDSAALVGDFCIELGKTDLYAKYEALQALPEDTVICLMKPYVAGKSSKEKHYVKEENLFLAIVEYKADTDGE